MVYPDSSLADDVLHAIGSRPMIPKSIRYWINSIPKESCALVNEVDDVKTRCILDIVRFVFSAEEQTGGSVQNPHLQDTGHESSNAGYYSLSIASNLTLNRNPHTHC